MKLVTSPLNKNDIAELKRECGSYLKITADLEKEQLVIGCELGEKILLQNGSGQDNIWGGGINLETKEIDTTAVLNIRPGLDNSGMEILDPERREKFVRIVKNIFRELWN